MDKATAYLSALLAKQLAEKGLVVWYDPDRCYADLAERLTLPETTVLRLKNGYFELRERLEPFLEFIGADGRPKADAERRPRVVVYVPQGRSAAKYALVEAEAAGAIVEPGANHVSRNSKLSVVADRVFRELAPAERAAEIARQAEQGKLTLEDLDRLAESAAEWGAGAVKLVFDTASPQEVALLFAAGPDRDAALEAKGALPELLAMIQQQFGVDLDVKAGPAAARAALRRGLLLADLIVGLPPKAVPDALASIKLPARRAEREEVRRLCDRWRKLVDLRDGYVQAARAVQVELGLASIPLDLDAVAGVETFPIVETRLLEHAENAILEGDPAKALHLVQRRRASFWSVQEASNSARWSLIETAASIFVVAARIRKEVKSVRKDAAAMVKAYCEGDGPWCGLDTCHRHLERRYAAFDLALGGEHDRLEQVVQRAREEYLAVVDVCAQAATSALEAKGFAVEGLLAQDRVYSKLVLPKIRSVARASAQARATAKVAYVLVDALRFEMGRELIAGLKEDFDVNLEPALAQMPSITEVGMSALMPGSDQGMELVDAGGGRVAVKVGSTLLKDRSARLRHLRSLLEVAVADLKLNDLLKPGKRVRSEIEAAQVIVVTSQEIDRRGEEGDDEDEARRYMDEVLDKLRKGVRRLAELGVRDLVVAADHGFLFAESLQEDRILDAPSGAEVDRHRRVWIGRGGATPPNCLRLSAAQVGLAGDLELVLPRTYACFRAAGSRRFFHGACSLQELVIPVCVLRARATGVVPAGAAQVRISMDKPRVTTRFFTLTACYSTTGLFGGEELRVRIVLKAGKQEVGEVAAAQYGFEGGTPDVVLRKDRPNVITLIVTGEPAESTGTIHVLDAVTQTELARSEGISISLMS